jgi:hypothetical protein
MGAVAACSDASDDDSDGGGSMAQSGSGGAAAQAGSGGAGGGAGSGTGLPLGTFCLKAGSEAERCEADGNIAERVVLGGKIDISIEHGPGVSACPAQRSNFSASASIPDGVPFPYANVSQAGIQFTLLSMPCAWTSFKSTSVSGTIFEAGTQGATRIEGELTMSGPAATESCEFPIGSCPQQINVSARFNLPL